MEKRQLEVANKAEFLKLLDAISKINDQGVILDIKDKQISALVSSLDSTLILHTNFDIDCDIETVLNIPDVKKLKHVLDTIEKDEIELREILVEYVALRNGYFTRVARIAVFLHFFS